MSLNTINTTSTTRHTFAPPSENKRVSFCSKITYLFLGALSFMSGIRAARAEDSSLNCWPNPDQNGATCLSRLPALPSHLLDTEIFRRQEGDAGYVTRDPWLRNHTQQMALVDKVAKWASGDPRVLEEARRAKTEKSKGYLLTDHSTTPPTKISLGLNPAQLADHKMATSYGYRWISDIENLSVNQICRRILTTHRILMSGIISKDWKFGEYREEPMLVDPTLILVPSERELEGIFKLLKQRAEKGLIPKKQMKFFKKEIYLPLLNGKIHSLSPKHQEFLKEVYSVMAYTAPPAKKIPFLMKKFAAKLKTKVKQMRKCSHFDKISLAAWVHQELVRIHPVRDGNGCLARLLMNEIFLLADFPTEVVPNVKTENRII